MEFSQKAFAELSSVFLERMEAFEGELKNATPITNIATLSSDFISFKKFILKSLKSIQDQLAIMSRSVDNLEMRTRRKILLLHGIPEEQQEDVIALVKNVVQTKLKCSDFTSENIRRCYRLGKPTSTRPRPILFKLSDVAVRSKIWAAKTKLKGSGMTLSEFLTKFRHDLFMRARQEFGISKCWTRDGIVFVLDHDGSRHSISCIEDLSKINPPQNTAVSVAVITTKEQSKTRPRAAKK